MSNSKRIAKNTLLLYFRMFLIMGVSLYTSRVVLQELGVSDFGIYSLVGGIVSMLGFFNAAMSSATQRYLSFDIGKGDEMQLQKTFSATLTIHFFIALLALILAETLGLWYINYKMVFNEDRLFAVNVVYQFSILTFLLNIIQVPYNSLILARERMNIYAYVSILEVLLKLGIVFLLVYGQDKLVLYGILTFIVALIIRLIYQFYCKKQFKESRYKFEYDKVYYSELLAFSGWNLFGNFVGIAKQQGVNVILNLVFGTILNAAYGITMQVQSAVQMFVSNFQMALNPSIVKEYAGGNNDSVDKLVIGGTKLSFLLLCVIVLPISFNLDLILELWLGKIVPSHTRDFILLTFVMILIDSLSGPIMTLVTATGKVRKYHIILSAINIWSLPCMYLVVVLFNEPFPLFYVLIVFSVLMYISRLYYVKKNSSLNMKKYLKEVVLRILIVIVVFTLLYIILLKPLFAVWELSGFSLLLLLLLSFLIIDISFMGCILLFGLSKNERKYLVDFVKKRI